MLRQVRLSSSHRLGHKRDNGPLSQLSKFGINGRYRSKRLKISHNHALSGTSVIQTISSYHCCRVDIRMLASTQLRMWPQWKQSICQLGIPTIPLIRTRSQAMARLRPGVQQQKILTGWQLYLASLANVKTICLATTWLGSGRKNYHTVYSTQIHLQLMSEDRDFRFCLIRIQTNSLQKDSNCFVSPQQGTEGGHVAAATLACLFALPTLSRGHLREWASFGLIIQQ